MLKNNLLAVLAILAFIFLILSIPNTAAYTAPKPVEIVVEEVEPEVATTTEIAPDHFRTKAILVKKTLISLESNGAEDCEHTPGASGEKGCFQYLHSTWVSYSLEVYGFIADQTAEHADYVTEEKIYNWLKAGYTPRDIFLIWNQGNAGPCKAGINSHGVPYDSCGYADRGVAKLFELSN